MHIYSPMWTHRLSELNRHPAGLLMWLRRQTTLNDLLTTYTGQFKVLVQNLQRKLRRSAGVENVNNFFSDFPLLRRHFYLLSPCIIVIINFLKMETILLTQCHVISLFATKERTQILSLVEFFHLHLWGHSDHVVGTCLRTEYRPHRFLMSAGATSMHLIRSSWS